MLPGRLSPCSVIIQSPVQNSPAHTRITFAHYIVSTFAPLDIPISIDCSLFLLHLPAVQDAGHEGLFSTVMRVQRRLVPFGIWCLLDH
jgi:hypothetical protein